MRKYYHFIITSRTVRHHETHCWNLHHAFQFHRHDFLPAFKKDFKVYITSLMTSNFKFVTGLNICISPVIYWLLNSYFMGDQCISIIRTLLVSFLLRTATLSTDRLPSIKQLSSTSLNLTDYSNDLQRSMCLFWFVPVLYNTLQVSIFSTFYPSYLFV